MYNMAYGSSTVPYIYVVSFIELSNLIFINITTSLIVESYARMERVNKEKKQFEMIA